MQVVIVTKYFIPDNSVDSTSSLELIIALLDRNPSIKIHVVTTNSNYKSKTISQDFFSSQLSIHKIKTLYNGNNRIMLFISGLIDGLRMVLKARSIQVKSIISLTNPPLISVWCALFLRKKQWFYWTFDLFPDAIISTGLISEDNLLYKYIHDLVYKNPPSALITLGEKQYNYLKNKYRIDIPNIILPCGIIKINSQLIDIYPEWYQSNRKYIGYIGNLGRAHSKQYIFEIIRHLYLLRDYFLILSIYGEDKEEIENFVESNKINNVILVPKVEKQHLSLIDIHLVSLLEKWTHISVPSKAVSAVCSGCILMFYGNQNSDTWSMFKDCSFLIEDLSTIPELFKTLSPAIIDNKREVAQKISKDLLDQQENAYDDLVELLQ